MSLCVSDSTVKKLLFILIFLPIGAYATPTITSSTGTVASGNSFAIDGAAFDAKPRGNNKPVIYWDSRQSTPVCDPAVSSNTWTKLQNVFKSTTVSEQRISGQFPLVSQTTWTALAGTDHGVFNLAYQLTTNSTDYAFKYIAGMYRRETYTITKNDANVKRWRVWNSNIDTDNAHKYPDQYFGHRSVDTDSSTCEYVELLSLNGGCRFFTDPVSSTWYLHQFRYLTNSAVNQTDGSFQVLKDNTQEYLKSNLSTSESANQVGSPNKDFNFQDEWSNYLSTSIDGNAYRDVAYLDWGWNAAYIGDAATFAACTHLEYQPYTNWTATSATLNLRLGTFTSGTTVYLYVKDNSDVPNASGYAIAVGNTYPAAANPAPTVTSISPNSGSTTGGTSATITGTNFLTGPTVTFGGSSATSVSFVNSTTITCITPAHAAGAVDVVVTNSDAQAGTGTGVFTFTGLSTVCPCK